MVRRKRLPFHLPSCAFLLFPSWLPPQGILEESSKYTWLNWTKHQYEFDRWRSQAIEGAEISWIRTAFIKVRKILQKFIQEKMEAFLRGKRFITEV